MNTFKIKCKLPSGLKIYVSELKNDSYLALHKFILNNDLEGFYNLLDNHIKDDYDQVKNLDILDKLYLYLSLYTYCIKSTIELQNKNINFFNQEESYSLFDTIENLQTINIKTIKKEFNTKQGLAKLEIGIPKQFDEINNEFTFNPLTSVKNININAQNYILNNPEDYKILEYIFTLENYYELTTLIIQNFNVNIILVPGKIELPLLSNKTYQFIAESLYYSDLDYQLTSLYSLQKYLNLSPTDYYNFTPADTQIILLKLIKDKQDEQKEAEKQNNRSNEKLF